MAGPRRGDAALLLVRRAVARYALSHVLDASEDAAGGDGEWELVCNGSHVTTWDNATCADCDGGAGVDYA